MTFREKLREDCPGLSEEAIKSIVACMSPHNLRYESPDGPCDNDVPNCIGCWDREIPGTQPINKTTLEPLTPRQTGDTP